MYEGGAVDVLLVKSASRPMSNDALRRLKDKREAAEGTLDSNRKPLNFSRDLESEWTLGDDQPYYGLKKYALVAVNNGFFLATTMSRASVHNTTYLSYLTAARCHTRDPTEKVYADKEFYGEHHRSFIDAEQ